MASYRVLNIDLTAARDRAEIIERDVGVTDITVLELPAGASASIALGPRPLIPLVQGQEIIDICPAETEALFLTNVAQPGVTMDLYVSFEGARVTLER